MGQQTRDNSPHLAAQGDLSQSPVLGYLRDRLAGQHPAYFAMAMATGIVSIDCHLLALHELAQLLFRINVLAYCALWALILARALFFPARLFHDLASHQRGPGFFTIVAATGVVGVQITVLGGNPEVGRALWWLSLALWSVCTYAIFVLLIVQKDKPSLADGINGGWLLAVVATQSVCVLGCGAGPELFGSREITLFFLTSLWLCGGMLYIWMISLIFYRYMFFTLAPSDLMPPYWINMGAVAISTLAGTALVTAAQGSPLLAPLLPFVKGFTMMYWATATWWIPMLLILGVWRHRLRRLEFSYDPLYWGLVFPLGMYSVCTYQLARILEASFLIWVARGFAIAALVAWLLTFLGMAKRLLYVLLLALRAPKKVGLGKLTGGEYES